MYKLLDISNDESNDKNNINYFINLMLRGMCVGELIDGVMMEIAVWFTKDTFENYRFIVGKL